MKNSVDEVLEYFSREIKDKIIQINGIYENLEEIRIRTNRNIILKIRTRRKKN